jgi:hypothetical protein
VTIDEEEETSEDGLDSESRDQRADSDTEDEWSDVVELKSSGVADILVTGEVGTVFDYTRPEHILRSLITYRLQTTELHRNAWGHYIYLGRVRRWDGLVVLLRTPVRTHQSLRRLHSLH